MNRALAQNPLLVMRLRGSQAAMGAQQGAVLLEHGGYEDAIAFYPTMASRLIALALPDRARRPFEHVAGVVLAAKSRVLHHHRRRLFPEYVARTEALLRAAGQPVNRASAFLVMDILQNTVGLLGRAGAFPAHLGRFAAVPACSSLAVWSDASSDGALRHARNFDFPGVGVWDEAPVVTFCEPDEGLRYGFVATRGGDVPGITCFNEAGLTLTAHTRFHRDVRYDGTAVVDFGHEIVRRAHTLDEAVAIAREIGSASTWGFLISSAAERDAIVVETTGAAVATSRPGPSANHLACTNRYLAPSLRGGEVTSSAAFVVDSDARYARLEACVREAVAGLSAEDLEALLGDFGGPDSVDRHDEVTRLSGDCIVSPMTVQSVVAEPESRSIRVSVGRAPTGFGPYVSVPWAWDGPVGSVDTTGLHGEASTHAHTGRGHRGAELDDHARMTARAYAHATRLHVEGASPAEVRAHFDALVVRAPNDPGFRSLAAFFAIRADDLEAAREHLAHALALEGGAFRRAKLLLFQSRVLACLGARDEARRVREELAGMNEPSTAACREIAAAEARRPLARARLRTIVPDVTLIDAALAFSA